MPTVIHNTSTSSRRRRSRPASDIGRSHSPESHMGSNLSKVAQDAVLITPKQDKLGELPTEIRLMIFEELLVLWPSPVFRGAREFGKLRKEEYKKRSEKIIPAAILQTCRRYHDEAARIIYGKNFFIFCTGYRGSMATSTASRSVVST